MYKPVVFCYCRLCETEVKKDAIEFDTEEKLVCEKCGAEYSDVMLAMEKIEPCIFKQ
jgi:protein-arginine kinase activator protein McsA